MLRMRIRLSLAIVAILAPAAAESLNPTLLLAQYGHTAWTLGEGHLSGYPRAIAQTTDGYLWLGTGAGLLRFDGARFVPWTPRSGSALPSGTITTLLATPDNDLWIGTTVGLSRLHNGTVTSVSSLTGHYVSSLLHDSKRRLWVGDVTDAGAARLCTLDLPSLQCEPVSGDFGRYILSLHQDPDGGVWIGASNGLWRLSTTGDRASFQPRPGQPEIHALISTPAGLLMSFNREVTQFAADRFETLNLGGAPIKPTALLRDRDGAIWIGTQDEGLIRVVGSQVDRFGRHNGLSGDFVANLHEDREGNIWVGTVGGLDRFREIVAARIPAADGFSNDPTLAVQAAANGAVWATTVGGLFRVTGRAVAPYRRFASNAAPGALLRDRDNRLWVSTAAGICIVASPDATPRCLPNLDSKYVHAMVQAPAGDIWISAQNGGLFRVRNEVPLDRFPWAEFGNREARSLLADAAGGVWLGFVNGGVSYLKDRRLQRSLDAASGLVAGTVNAMAAGHSGVWVATEEGLSHVGNERISSLSTVNGLPCGSIQWLLEDRERHLWLHAECGLIRIAPTEIAKWLTQGADRLDYTVYDTADGVLRYSDLGGYGPKVTTTGDGRIWFATYDGLAVVDPARLPANTVRPPVQIEAAVGDGVDYDVSESRTLPPLLRDLRIDFTALSLVAPEKTRFRYRLEGRDQEWNEVLDRRQAFYTDLPPGHYRFRVVAANNRGVWNEQGDTWDFTIEHAFYQASSFRIGLVLLLSLAAYALYRYRLRAMTSQLNLRFEERLDERTLIARDLHDTLLQGFISCSMQLRMLAGEVSDERLKPKLDRIIDRVSMVIDEGRNTVTGLRVNSPEDLEAALLRDCELFRNKQFVEIKGVVNGERRPLTAAVRDSMYQVGREALANVFRHANASRVEIEIEYAHAKFNLVIRDNGVGIEQSVIDSGRSGHWGLQHMRERTEKIGGQFTVLSRIGAGTEIKVSVPNIVAFDGNREPGLLARVFSKRS
jgi:signal transduction histidine kinase/ligand-binding sensor domain-containing protein